MLDQLEKARRDLLELTTRTRLLSTPRRKNRIKTIEVKDEISEQVFRILVRDGKGMSFDPRPDDEEDHGQDEPHEDSQQVTLLAQPEDEDQEGEVASRHRDTKLQTEMTSAALQKRLLSMYYDARSYIEEQGVNILYLTLGFLKWYEAEASDTPRYAPLILIPVTIERRSARSKFRVEYSGEELSTNLSLQAKLKMDFGVMLPDLSPSEELDPSQYYARVEKALRSYSRWEVLPNDIVLGFFSFAKLLMYRDLDASNWPDSNALGDHPLLQGLLTAEGFPGDVSPFPPDPDVDEILDPADMVHVLDADSSQATAIEETRTGRNLVIQGPPGTGKSQTITNVIASAVREGKRVLFVAEKMAALEVVKRRLDDIGLGCICLELHSHRARKKTVLADLESTLSIGRPKGPKGTSAIEALRKRRDQLNEHARKVHTPLDPSGYTPFRIAGHLIRLSEDGTHPPDYQLLGALEWTKDDFEGRKRLTRNLAIHIDRIGTPTAHPWKGLGLDAVLPADVERIGRHARSLRERMSEWILSVEKLANFIGCSVRTFKQVNEHLNLAERILGAPRMDRGCLASDVWESKESDVIELVNKGQELEGVREELEGVLIEEAWEEDWGEVRRAFAAHGGSWLRLLKKDYREARKALQAFGDTDLPKRVSERLEVLSEIRKGQRLREEILNTEEIGQAAFGSRWEGYRSPWADFESVVEWVKETAKLQVPSSFRDIVSGIQDDETLQGYSGPIREDLERLRESILELFSDLDLDLQEAFDREGLDIVPLSILEERLVEWAEMPEKLQEWVTLRALKANAEEEDLGKIVVRLYDGRLSPDQALPSLEYAFFEELMRRVYDLHPALATFASESHEKLIEEFRELDKKRIAIARREVARSHHDGIPEGGAEIGELGLIKREIRKQRRHLPLRQLMKRAGRAIQSIKPVFMMSPLSVAQYIPPGSLEFDILLIDEASQVQPVEALGAIARSKQMVVVGDEKQLPPTRFFTKMLDEDWNEEEEEEGGFTAGDLESILGLSLAQGVPDRMLEWHYRSRHESLIALSNHHFYDDRLFVVPSAKNPDNLGLKFHAIDGTYDRGGTATNRVEARHVAKAVLEHARDHPAITLGVGAFSVSQRDAILDELELLRRNHPETEEFFRSSGLEPFFVKNLEAIQGDERDVIFISVGYGPDPSGYISMNFGPLSNEGGERRLNVLITRARERCEVFSSIGAADIDLNRARGAGPAALKKFLHYAKTRNLDVARPSGEEPDSPFEEEVARALRKHGHEVDHQVGVAGFYIDLAIRDPEKPGDYLLGIECDGASYHSARWARDRDRLREKVLRDRGWRLHRIWSTDWFRQPQDQLRRTLAAIEKAAAANTSTESLRGGRESAEPELERTHGREVEATPTSWVGKPYEEADLSVDVKASPHRVPQAKMCEVVERIVAWEGPVHEEEIARRVTSAWGLQRTGSRIQDATREALRKLVRAGEIAKAGPFYSPNGESWVPPRSRQGVGSATLKRPEMLPPAEIRTGLQMAVKQHIGVAGDDVIVEVTRMFGFQRAGGNLKTVIRKQLQQLIKEGTILNRQGKLYLS